MAHIVIVGGGVAAGTAAQTLREEGCDADVTVVTAESHPPYQRPPLSKGYLAGEEGLDAAVLHPAEWYADHGIDLQASTEVLAASPAAHRIETTRGDLAYDSLLIATGASPRRLPIEGSDLPGVHSLRTLDDADALADELRGGGRKLVLIGSGWIGMEVAATARTLGNEVTILERDAVPLAVAVGPQLGEVFRTLHEEHGVDLRTSVQVERIAGHGRAEGVVVDGDTVPADLVLIGVGAVPNTGLATAAGLTVQNGILVDAGLRTSAPDVYAAGDVANAYHPVIQRHLRSEHWANALNAGPVAARNMMGGSAVHDGIPYFYTDQYDLGMELSGYPPLMADAELVIRGDLAAREFVAFWVDDGRVVGGMNVNVWDVQDAIQELIRSGERVPAAALTDLATPLDQLLGVTSPVAFDSALFDLSRHIAVMAIVNRTPDSFYDRGATFALDAAVAAGAAAVEAGAEIVDVGGVKFGPGPPVPAQEEIDRVVPVVRELSPFVAVSVDTFLPEVARAAIDAGAAIINDTTGLHDPAMADVVAEGGATIVIAHSLAVPRTQFPQPHYDDIAREVGEFLVDRREFALSRGVPAAHIVLDPGHDLNKNTLQTLELTRRLGELTDLGAPLLVALSNKDFIGETLDRDRDERVWGSIAATVYCVLQGARIVRAHNVCETVDAMRMVEAILGWREPAYLVHNMRPEGND